MNVTIRPKDILEHIVTHTLGTAIEDELGSGYYGDAFLLEDGNVAKLTRSMTEGIYAARLLGQSHPNLVNIHSVHCLDYADSKQFLIVQEFINTDHPLVEEANNSMDLIMERGHSIYEYFDFNDLDTDEQEILQSHGFSKKSRRRCSRWAVFSPSDGEFGNRREPVQHRCENRGRQNHHCAL